MKKLILIVLLVLFVVVPVDAKEKIYQVTIPEGEMIVKVCYKLWDDGFFMDHNYYEGHWFEEDGLFVLEYVDYPTTMVFSNHTGILLYDGKGLFLFRVKRAHNEWKCYAEGTR